MQQANQSNATQNYAPGPSAPNKLANVQKPPLLPLGQTMQGFQTPKKGTEAIPPVGETQQLHALIKPELYPVGYPQHEQLMAQQSNQSLQNMLAVQMPLAQNVTMPSQIMQMPQMNVKQTAPRPTCDVTVMVKCPQTYPGERVAVLGASDELGRWDIERATFLETNDQIFPTWTVKLRLPRDTTTEYKYLIIQLGNLANTVPDGMVGQRASYSVRWESLGVNSTENRKLNTFGKKAVHLQEEFGNKQVIEEYVEDRSTHAPPQPPQMNLQALTRGSPDLVGSVDLRQGHLQTSLPQNMVQPNQTVQKLPQPYQPISINAAASTGSKEQYFSLQNKVNEEAKNSLSMQGSGSIEAKPSAGTMGSGVRANQSNLSGPAQLQPNILQQIASNASLLSGGGIGQLLGLTSGMQAQPAPSLGHNSTHQLVPSSSNPTELRRATTEQLDKSKTSVKTGEKFEKKEDESPDRLSSAVHKHEKPANNTAERRIETGSRKIPQRRQSLLSDFASKEQPLDKQEPIIVATFLLPYAIGRDRKTGALSISPCFHNPTLLYGTLENMRQKKQFNFKWVGLVTTLEDMSDLEKADLEEQFRQRDAYPIFMTAEETGPYLMFYENQMRPLFHNFKDLYDLRSELNKHWKSFVEVSQRFADKIVEVKNALARAGSKCTKIWVHNNQLIMVPLYVRKQFEQANIGFSCHSPFPSSAHFRTFKFRLKVLESLLNCDLIAFHLFMYARNFIKTCERILGLELEFLRGGHMGINFQGKHVLVRVSHIGIEQSFIEDLSSARQFETGRKSFRTHISKVGAELGLGSGTEDKKQERAVAPAWLAADDQDTFMEQADKPIIMSSIDSYHPISGLKQKLRAYRNFLEKYPAYRNRIIFIQFVGSTVQAFDQAEGHQRQVSSIRKMRDDIIALVEDIQKKYGKSSLMFEESNPSLTRRLVLWSESDIIWCSSLKDGLCIQVLEYVVCRKLVNKMAESIMICSEFAGCNEAMRGVLRYNPFSYTGFEEQMEIAMQMTKKQRLERMQLAYSHIQRTSMTKWTENFLVDLSTAYQPNLTSYYLGMTLSSRTRAGKNIGTSNRLMPADRKDFTKLNLNQCYSHLLKAKRSVIIVEMEALPHQKFTKNSIPTVEVIEQLHSLMTDSRNTVIIIGNHNKTSMEDWFLKTNKLAANGANFWLAAESGYLYTAGNDQKWQKLGDPNGRGDRTADFSWKTKVRKIMQGFAENIDGSFIEERESCILWNFKNTESEHSNMFVQELYSTTQKVLEKHHRQTYGHGPSTTDIILGNGYLEVKPAGVKKKKLVNLLLERISKTLKIDFLFYLGNDTEDEVVFEFLKSRDIETKGFIQPDCSRYICVLDKKPSEADYYLEDLDHVRPLLQKFQTATQNRKRNFSCADLSLAAQEQSSGLNLSNKKLQSAAKNASIANLSLYMHGSIGLDENQRFQSSSGLIPYQQRGKQGSFANLSVNNQIIEEGARESSDEESVQGQKLRRNKNRLAENRHKFPSVGDTTKKVLDEKVPSKQPTGTETSAQLEGGQQLSATVALTTEKVTSKPDIVAELPIVGQGESKSQPPSARAPLEKSELDHQQSETKDKEESESFFHNRKSPNQNNALELPSIRRDDSEFESFKDKRDEQSLNAKSMFTVDVVKTLKETVDCVDDFSKHSHVLQKNEVSDMMSVGDVGPHKGQATVAFHVGQGLTSYNANNSQNQSPRSNGSINVGSTNMQQPKHYDSERFSNDNFQNAVEADGLVMDSSSAQLPVAKKFNEQFDSFSSTQNADVNGSNQQRSSPVSALIPSASFGNPNQENDIKEPEADSDQKKQKQLNKVDSQSASTKIGLDAPQRKNSALQTVELTKHFSGDQSKTPDGRNEGVPFINSDFDMHKMNQAKSSKHNTPGQSSVPQFKLALKNIQSNDQIFGSAFPLKRQQTGGIESHIQKRDRLLSGNFQDKDINDEKIEKMSAKESFKLMLKLDEMSDKPGASGGAASGLKKKMSNLGALVSGSKLASAARDDESSIEDMEADNLIKGDDEDGEANMMDFDQLDNSDEVMQ